MENCRQSRQLKMIALPRRDHPRVAGLLAAVPINTLFARAVVEGHVGGRVYVDDPACPGAVYVAHPYGMSLLFGRTDQERFNEALRSYLIGISPRRTGLEWLQVYPDEWSVRLEALLGSRLAPPGVAPGTCTEDRGVVLQDVRVNFRFDGRRYAHLRESLTLPPGCEIVDDPDTLYASMSGSVVPRAFWDTCEAFGRRGVARAVRCHGELASTAFASFVIGDALEIGIETYEHFRGRGLAVHACSALIDHCLDRGLEPVWACRWGNTASYRLALRLGFEHIRSLPYYRLPESAGLDDVQLPAVGEIVRS